MSQSVVLRNVAKTFGSVCALKTINLEIKEGEFITLLGPSGCGKTTTLRLIAGFNDPDQGQILLGDEEITNLPPQKREIGMVFQDYALFPHLTIKENIAFPLRERRTPKENIDDRVTELLELVRLAWCRSALSLRTQRRTGSANRRRACRRLSAKSSTYG